MTDDSIKERVEKINKLRDKSDIEEQSRLKKVISAVGIITIIILQFYFIYNGQLLFAALITLPVVWWIYFTDRGKLENRQANLILKEFGEYISNEVTKEETTKSPESINQEQICQDCGWQNSKENNFCHDCGAKIGSE